MTRPFPIRTAEELHDAFAESHERPVMIFKHSVVCGASAAAHRTWEEFVAARPGNDDIGWALLVVQHARALSDEVAARTGVRHQSPQAILLRNGRAVWNASHWNISEESLGEAVAAAAV